MVSCPSFDVHIQFYTGFIFFCSPLFGLALVMFCRLSAALYIGSRSVSPTLFYEDLSPHSTLTESTNGRINFSCLCLNFLICSL